MTDAKLLGIIIHNLIDNAIKIQHKNKIRIYTDYINGHLHLIFEDDGPGMPPALTQWLNSNEFFDNHNLQSQYEGIGLLMIKQISQILNLDLSVENKPGACIHVIFNEKTEYQAQTTIIS
jgi:sensor histidine kinase regulating citrate/malate metabolism